MIDAFSKTPQHICAALGTLLWQFKFHGVLPDLLYQLSGKGNSRRG